MTTHTHKQTHKDAFSQLIYSNADFLCKGRGKQTEVVSTSPQVAEVQLCPMAHGHDGFVLETPVSARAPSQFVQILKSSSIFCAYADLEEKKCLWCLWLIRKEQRVTSRLGVTSLF